MYGLPNLEPIYPIKIELEVEGSALPKKKLGKENGDLKEKI